MEYTRFCPSKINTETHPHLVHVTKCWETTDGKYSILYDKVNGYEHLRVSRVDDKPIHNYMDLQEIKNDLFGDDVVAVEIYPRKSDFTDGSNTYHLWAWAHRTPNLAEIYKYADR